MTDPKKRETVDGIIPGITELSDALKAAGSAHHEYEQTALNGVYDEEWPMFYAAFVLGRHGEFTTPSLLTQWLKESPTDGVWADTAARHILEKCRAGNAGSGLATSQR